MSDPNDPAAVAGAAARKPRGLGADVIAEGMIALVRTTLSELFTPELVDKAMQKARRDPTVKAMLDKVKTKSKPPKVKGQEGITGGVRSAYQAFATLCMHYNSCHMKDVALFWRAMPADLKERVTARLDMLKADVAERLKRDEKFTLSDALKDLEARHNLAPLPWAAFTELREGGAGMEGFDVGPEQLAGHGAAAAAAAAADEDEEEEEEEEEEEVETTSGDDDEEEAPPPKPVVPAAKPAVAPAAPGSPEKRKGVPAAAGALGVPEAKKQKKDKEGKKAAAPAAPAAAAAPSPAVHGEKKHKKHKKVKEEAA